MTSTGPLSIAVETRTPYTIRIGSGAIAELPALLRAAVSARRLALVTDATVERLHAEAVLGPLRHAGLPATCEVIDAGERHKTRETKQRIEDHLIEAGLSRDTVILGLGGGVVTDLAGFVAATYMRGIPWVALPTTLLAMVDASIGGKTAVDHPLGKNLIGAFHQPALVVVDVDFLRTLPEREMRQGLAEVAKAGIIGDADLFALLSSHADALARRDAGAAIEIIGRACAVKASVVAADEKESDLRQVLNFGHTIGHALEAVTGYTQFLHGEAVAVGMAKAALLSTRYGFCDAESLQRVVQLLANAGLPSEIPGDVSLTGVIQAMEVDKKAAGGKIKFVMCEGIGKTRFHWLAPSEILNTLGA